MATRRRSTTRRTSTTRKTASAKAAKPAPVAPVVGPGERLFVLSVPFDQRGVAAANGARWDAHTRQTIYIGPSLPHGLTPYAAQDYSWERYVEDDLNGSVLEPAVGAARMTPRPHQQVAADRIASMAAKGWRGFIEADDVGLGKTLASLKGALQVAADRRAKTMLIVCPKGVIPHWRNTLRAAGGAPGLRVVVINYDQVKKLLTVPKSAEAAKKTRTKNKKIAAEGKPVVDWDLILLDESHMCFPYDTLVETDAGPLPIGQIVEDRRPVKVLSRDDETGETVYRKITHRFCHPSPAKLVRVTHASGAFVTTPDHPIWTEEHGYVEAADLLAGNRDAHLPSLRNRVRSAEARERDGGDVLPVLSQQVLEDRRAEGLPREGEAGDRHDSHSDLRAVRDRLSGADTEAGRDAPLLLESLRGNGPHGTAGATGGAVSGCARTLVDSAASTQGEEAAGRSEADAREQPDAQPGDAGEDDRKQAGCNVSVARGEWAVDAAPDTSRGGDGAAHGIRHRPSGVVVARTGHSESSHELQGRPGSHRVEDRDRSRRCNPQDATLAVLGSSEDGHTRPSRVVSVEVLERGSAGRPGRGSGADQNVYNIEVAGHHNYFADGVLVHNCKNQESQRTKAMSRIARYAAAAKDAPFVIWMSATIGQNPAELAYLSPVFTQITGAPRSALSDFGQWLADEGFAVTWNARFKKWDWGVIPADATAAEVEVMNRMREKDLKRVNRMLFGPDAPSIRRLPTDIAGWPEIQRIPMPVDLDLAERALYEQAWTEFRAAIGLARRGKDPKGALAARTRFRQKASLIRVPGTVEQVLGLIENGRQVAVSVEWIESLDAIREALERAKVACAEFSGRNEPVREQERLRFQRGYAQVMLFTVTAGISLHQGEQLPDGSLASDVPRATVVHDPRYSGLDSIQIEGRTHRDGKASNVYYSFAVGTVEQQITRTLLSRIRSTKTMSGDDVTVLRELENLLDSTADSAPAGVGAATPAPGPAAAATTAVDRPARPAAAGPVRRAPAAPAGDRSMTPEERAFRDALAGGRARSAAKRVATPAEKAALRARMGSRQN